jgi:hypothetical protein
MSNVDVNPIVITPNGSATFTHHARTMVLNHGEKILSEIPKTLRRVALLMLVLSISIPAFLGALLIVLWRLG